MRRQCGIGQLVVPFRGVDHLADGVGVSGADNPDYVLARTSFRNAFSRETLLPVSNSGVPIFVTSPRAEIAYIEHIPGSPDMLHAQHNSALTTTDRLIVPALARRNAEHS